MCLVGDHRLCCFQQARLFPQAVIYCYITAISRFCPLMPSALFIEIWGYPPSSAPLHVINFYWMSY